MSGSALVMFPDFRILSTSDSLTGDSKLPERGELVIMNITIKFVDFISVLTNSELASHVDVLRFVSQLRMSAWVANSEHAC